MYRKDAHLLGLLRSRLRRRFGRFGQLVEIELDVQRLEFLKRHRQPFAQFGYLRPAILPAKAYLTRIISDYGMLYAKKVIIV